MNTQLAKVRVLQQIAKNHEVELTCIFGLILQELKLGGRCLKLDYVINNSVNVYLSHMGYTVLISEKSPRFKTTIWWDSLMQF